MTTNNLPICTVLCRFWGDDGKPDTGASIEAELNRPDVMVNYGIVSPKRITATADANGECSIELWPNALGTRGSLYTIKVRSGSGGLIKTVGYVPAVADIQLFEISEFPDASVVKSLGQINIEAAIASAAEAKAALAELTAGDALLPPAVEGFVAFTYLDNFGARHLGRISRGEMALIFNDMVKTVDLTNPQFVENGAFFDMPTGYTDANFTLRTVSVGMSLFAFVGDCYVTDGDKVFVPLITEHAIENQRVVASGVKR